MKKIVSILVVTIFAVSMLTACHKSDNQDALTKEQIFEFAGPKIKENCQEELQSQVDLWVGDSRTVGMFQYLFADYEAHLQGDSFPQTLIYKKCLAKDGQGFYWMTEAAYPKICELLDKKADATLVFNMGVNDCNYVSADTYVTFYRELQEKYPQATIYIMSINPLKEGYPDYEAMTKCIDEMNQVFKQSFGDHYIDTSGYMLKTGFETEADCIHYLKDTYRKIYYYTLLYISTFVK